MAARAPRKILVDINPHDDFERLNTDVFLQQELPVRYVTPGIPSTTTNNSYDVWEATVSLVNDFTVFERELDDDQLRQTVSFPRKLTVDLTNAANTDSAFQSNVLESMEQLFNRRFCIQEKQRVGELEPDFLLCKNETEVFLVIECKKWNAFMTSYDNYNTIDNERRNGGQFDFNNLGDLREGKRRDEPWNQYCFRKGLNQLIAYLFGMLLEMNVEVGYGILTSYFHTYFLIVTREGNGATVQVSPVVRNVVTNDDQVLRHIAKFIWKALSAPIASIPPTGSNSSSENSRGGSNPRTRRSRRIIENAARNQQNIQNPMPQPQADGGRSQQRATGGEYLMGEIIAYGRSGPVRKIFDREGHPFVAKIVGERRGKDLKEASKEDIVRELQNEVTIYETLGDLQGDVVPELYFDGFMDDHFYTLVMQELKAVPLHNCKHLSPEDKDAVRHALAKIHQKGVLHRDISPANILIGKNNHAYFIDFAMSTTCGSMKDFEEEKKDVEALLQLPVKRKL